MRKFNIKEGVGRTSLKKKCHGYVDYSRNINENLIAVSFSALNQYLFGITRGALVLPKVRKNK